MSLREYGPPQIAFGIAHNPPTKKRVACPRLSATEPRRSKNRPARQSGRPPGERRDLEHGASDSLAPRVRELRRLRCHDASGKTHSRPWLGAHKESSDSPRARAGHKQYTSWLPRFAAPRLVLRKQLRR